MMVNEGILGKSTALISLQREAVSLHALEKREHTINAD